MNGLAIKTGKSLKMDIADNIDTVFTNEEALEQIIENILSNALRYAKSSVLLTVRETRADKNKETESIKHGRKSTDEPESHITIQIIDDGSGIKKEELLHIFERHYKGEEGCFGFGLAIANAAARNIGAELTAKNVEDGGACFTLTL